MGIYEYQSTTITGDPKDGEEIHITARAVDFIDKAKGGDRRHYDEENGFGTAGKIFDDLASEMGVAAVIPSGAAQHQDPLSPQVEPVSHRLCHGLGRRDRRDHKAPGRPPGDPQARCRRIGLGPDAARDYRAPRSLLCLRVHDRAKAGLQGDRDALVRSRTRDHQA
jgi:hypothetical protein